MSLSLIAYDVHRNSVRLALSKRLEKTGTRLQRSVFVVEQQGDALKELEDWAREKLEDGDSLLVLPFCSSCLAKARFADAHSDTGCAVFV